MCCTSVHAHKFSAGLDRRANGTPHAHLVVEARLEPSSPVCCRGYFCCILPAAHKHLQHSMPHSINLSLTFHTPAAQVLEYGLRDGQHAGQGQAALHMLWQQSRQARQVIPRAIAPVLRVSAITTL